jgi:hypothetical protein
MEQALGEIEALLRKYRHIYHANLAEIARQQWRRDPAAACRGLNSAGWWGKDDAVAALDLALDGGFSSEARRDGQALRRALVAVYEQMRAYGEPRAEAQIMVSQFRKWLSSSV